MYLKLLKHEWKSSSKLLITLSACILGIALLAGLDLRLIISTLGSESDSSFGTILMIPAFLFMFIAIFSLGLYCSGVLIILLYRFYKSRFTDEGYLTFTLPVKTEHIFLSSALHMLIWEIICVIVVLTSALIIIFTGIPISEIGYEEFAYAMSTFFSELGILFDSKVFQIYMIVLPIAMIASGVLLPMSCVVIGSAIAKKHKILATIGIYYGCSTVTGIISGMISAITTIMIIQSAADPAILEMITPLLTTILPLLMGIAGYFLSIHLRKNKLNLP